MKICYVALSILFFIPTVMFGSEPTGQTQSFIESFLQHYEYGPEGRYTHEYHPFLLQWTRDSLSLLEQNLRGAGFDVSGRMIIMGYEEQAVPQYYTDFKKARIDDEATKKQSTGWSLRLHNRFGFMTGFLFKDLCAQKSIFPPETDHVFCHVDGERIPLFNDMAVIFQEHAFGQALPLMQSTRKTVASHLIKALPRSILQELIVFWQALYSGSFKVGNNLIAGTQDVLFSIAYAQHLSASQTPILKFFTGPDITYPIEVSEKLQKDATQHAQQFVKVFINHLQPIDNQETVYVFCSFVDGVGKSTTLGNIKNWLRHGLDIEKFEHVDNTSSQLCDIFKFKDKVFIADLPAQISHFTYKPDGMVFVDARTCCSKTFLTELSDFVCEHKKKLCDAWKDCLDQTCEIIGKKGFFESEFMNEKDAATAFARNIMLLKKEQTNEWVPFMYQDAWYLFKDDKLIELRKFVPLNVVKSEGLKTIEAEQMCFFDGLRLPHPYPVFMNDMVCQCNARGIKKIVFVDFLSMYPRSSRENIRVNYLLQQCALLDADFDVKHSLYHTFVGGAELLSILLKKRSVDKIQRALYLETFLRYALFRMLDQHSFGNQLSVPISSVTDFLRTEYKGLQVNHAPFVETIITQKLDQQRRVFFDLYGNTKAFVNIQQLSLLSVCAFSELLQRFFLDVDAGGAEDVWDIGKPMISKSEICTDNAMRLPTFFNDSRPLAVYYSLHQECKSELLLTPMLRALRGCWYSKILDLLTVSKQDRKYYLKNSIFTGIPLLLVKGSDDLVYAVERACGSTSNVQDSVSKYRKKLFDLLNLSNTKPSAYVVYKEIPYRVDWDSKGTQVGIMGFSVPVDQDDDLFWNLEEDQYPVNQLLKDYQRLNAPGTVMPTSTLWESLEPKVADIREKMLEKATKNGPYNARRDFCKMVQKSEKNVYLGTDAQRKIVRKIIRLLATLEMMIKDPDASIVVRYPNRDDFAAALKLFEHVVLPEHLGVIFKNDLFNDYEEVEPYPSWDFWQNLN